MSKYTTEVRFLCETEAGLTESRGFNSIDSILQEAAPKIFNFDFPIFDETYRLPLEIKILRYYYTREICEETVGLWKLRLQNKLNLIMPYYNQLYESELIKFNPLYDVDLTTDHERKNKTDETTETTGSETGNSTTNYNETQTIDTDTTDNTIKMGTEDTSTHTVIDTDTTDTETKSFTEKTTNNDGITTNTDVHFLDSEGITTVIDTDTTNSNTNTPNTTVTSSGTSTNTGTSNNASWDLYSDTPQGGVVGLTEAWDSVAGNAYLTNARRKIDEGSTSDNGSTSGTTTTTGTISDNGSGTIDTTERKTRADESSTITSKTETIAREENVTHTENISDTGTVDTDETGTINVEKSDTVSNAGTLDTTNEKTGKTVTDTTKDFINNGTSNITGLENYIQHVLGKSPGKSYSAMLNEFRDTFLNIDRMIINDLGNLFFGLW